MRSISALLLGVGINTIYSQISLAGQLPKTETLSAQNYNYSSACYYCRETPILTGNLKNRIIQLEKYIADFDKFHSNKFQYSFEVVKYGGIRSELKAWSESLKKQLKRARGQTHPITLP
jgi:hypothetical protein